MQLVHLIEQTTKLKFRDLAVEFADFLSNRLN
jgi:hypothetical protein